ncbi:nicotinate-nucleotide--dimethylbenzimidazole phosphoribosyltransferase [Veillonella rodentium]|uniref:Nicotinate-nucleotide--dimethylbenzimidazole phosphoribosyltransferase n=1 Tax=Veillonella rodentium TaxID=248315 RepID=A0A239ZN45_9FIRM|nr:nicotinate-nucleotide--dimethylbenzimidazole phosphoribosyltransferase [Veillonella rodentium]SNV72652.1 Nicotinate-nucleotide--dimethylbenzimidazole phosphoribosyltransferase [Veillonella rodentium]
MRTFTIEPLHAPSMEACRLRIDNLTKPIYSLATLETIAERFAGILGNPKPNHLRHGVLVVAADHLVDGPQNSQHGSESYAAIKHFNEGTTATQGAAFKLNADVHVVNVGLEQDTSRLEHIDTKVVRKGSHFFGVEPVISREELDRAIDLGFTYADKLHDDGLQVVAIGNIGERAFLDALVTTATITGCAYDDILVHTECGPTVEQRAAQIHSFVDRFNIAVDDWSALSESERRDAVLHLLHVAGGLDIAFLTGFILGAAGHRMAVVFDNAVTGAAVLAAVTIDPLVMDYVFPSAAYDEPIHKEQCRFLEVKPCLYYNLQIDEALGSTMGLSVIDASMHMLNDMKTFVEAEVQAAEDGVGKGRQKNKE